MIDDLAAQEHIRPSGIGARAASSPTGLMVLSGLALLIVLVTLMTLFGLAL